MLAVSLLLRVRYIFILFFGILRSSLEIELIPFCITTQLLVLEVFCD
jgi:hypothetical protein